ncbi:MAG: TonB-dependent receptor, partial [Pseudomonadota bacterium]
MKRSHWMKSVSAGAMAACAATGGASAQVEEIVVTTQKREQSLRDVPVNITAYSGDFLDRIGVQQFDELADFVPGLEIQEQSPNNPGFVIRGITSDSGGADVEPRVSIFQDGVSISKSRGSFVELFDLERVEVAKGPQSTLFGRGALIGGINIIQAKPKPELSAGITAEYGNNGYDMVEGFVNAPIVGDVLMGRVAVRHKTRDGYVDNALGGTDFNSVEMAAGRATLRFNPGAALDANLILNYQHDTPAGTAFKSGTFAPPGGDLNPSNPAALNAFGDIDDGSDLGLDREVWGATLLLDGALTDALSYTSITAFRRFDSIEVFDPDGFSLPVFLFAEDATGEQWSQEFRLIFEDGGPVSGFLGGSWIHQEGQQRVPLQYDERAFFALTGGLLTDPFNVPTIDVLDQQIQGLIGAGLVPPIPFKPIHQEEFSNFEESDSFDVFADVTVEVFEGLELTAGGRWTYDDKR